MGARPAPLRQHRLLPTVTKNKQQRNMSSARRHDTDSDDDLAQESRCKSNSRGAHNFSDGDDNDYASILSKGSRSVFQMIQITFKMDFETIRVRGHPLWFHHQVMTRTTREIETSF
jgi:hypothetical protein